MGFGVSVAIVNGRRQSPSARATSGGAWFKPRCGRGALYVAAFDPRFNAAASRAQIAR